MSRRYILAYLEASKICPWGQYREVFCNRFDELFGKPSMAAYQQLANRMHVSGDTIRRLYIGQEGGLHVYPKSGVLPELERAMELAPGSLGGSFALMEAPPAQVQQVEGVNVRQAPGLHPGEDTMPLGSDLEDSTPGSFPTGAFYEIALHNLQTSWSLTLLKNLPRTLMQMSTNGKFPVYCEDNGKDIRLVSPYHLPGSTRPMSQVFTGEARAKVLGLMHPIDPGKAFLVLGQVYEGIVVEAQARTTEQALGEAKMDDVLAKFRVDIGTLSSIADELKVLQVDAEDLVEANKGIDLRMDHISKRVRTARRKLSDVVNKFNKA